MAKHKRVFGPIHGIEVGMSWETRRMVCDVGVHVHPTKLIIDSKEHGVYSLVVTDNERGRFNFEDNGDRLICNITCSENQEKLEGLALSFARNGLTLQYRNGKPIRVIRKGKPYGQYGLLDGYRYDGLYKVLSFTRRTEKAPGWRIELLRDDPAPAPWTDEGKKYIEDKGFTMQKCSPGHVVYSEEDSGDLQTDAITPGKIPRTSPYQPDTYNSMREGGEDESALLRALTGQPEERSSVVTPQSSKSWDRSSISTSQAKKRLFHFSPSAKNGTPIHQTGIRKSCVPAHQTSEPVTNMSHCPTTPTSTSPTATPVTTPPSQTPSRKKYSPRTKFKKTKYIEKTKNSSPTNSSKKPGNKNTKSPKSSNDQICPVFNGQLSDMGDFEGEPEIPSSGTKKRRKLSLKRTGPSSPSTSSTSSDGVTAISSHGPPSSAVTAIPSHGPPSALAVTAGPSTSLGGDTTQNLDSATLTVIRLGEGICHAKTPIPASSHTHDDPDDESSSISDIFTENGRSILQTNTAVITLGCTCCTSNVMAEIKLVNDKLTAMERENNERDEMIELILFNQTVQVRQLEEKLAGKDQEINELGQKLTVALAKNGEVQPVTSPEGQTAQVQTGTDQVEPKSEEDLPEMVQVQPEMVQVQPEMVQVQPEMDHAQPEMHQVQPEMVQVQPEMVQVQPEMDHAQSEMHQVQPEMDHAQPEMHQVQPEMVQVQPEMVQVQPEMDHAQPEMHQVQPEMVQVQPEMVQVQPEMDHAQPEMHQVQPEMHQVQHEMVQVQPKRRCTKPYQISDFEESDYESDDSDTDGVGDGGGDVEMKDDGAGDSHHDNDGMGEDTRNKSQDGDGNNAGKEVDYIVIDSDSDTGDGISGEEHGTDQVTHQQPAFESLGFDVTSPADNSDSEGRESNHSMSLLTGKQGRPTRGMLPCYLKR